jgi:hypothetical protein
VAVEDAGTKATDGVVDSDLIIDVGKKVLRERDRERMKWRRGMVPYIN